MKTQLEKATLGLDKTTDVEGILIVASDGRILHHNLRVDVDMNLFGPMSQVISNSSHRLLSSSGQGEMERVLVESSGGKGLFLGLEKAHLIILMQDTANVGLILVNAKRASQKINEATHDLELEIPAEVIKEPSEIPAEVLVEEVPLEEPTITEETPTDMTATEEAIPEKITAEISPEPTDEGLTEEPITEVTEHVKELDDTEKVLMEDTPKLSEVETEMEVSTPISESSAPVPEAPVPEPGKVETAELGELKEITVGKEPEIVELDVSKGLKEEKISEEKVEEEIKELKPSIPTVKPPISFPTLPEHVEVPDEPEQRSDLILDIYEKIFLAMSLGAAKIMGVAPARGLTKQFLPFEKCQRLLQNVDLKSNATIDFAQIKKNASEIPTNEREEIFIRDFSRMIEIITENYGRVMGYEAFRGMVRAEFLAINKSYGDAIDKLEIKQNMHPEIALLFS